MADFIDVLLNASSGTHLPFRILLTSRVEEHIRKKFDTSRFLHRLELENFDAHLDIEVHFWSAFIASMMKIGESCRGYQSPGHQLKISLHFLTRLAVHLHLLLH